MSYDIISITSSPSEEIFIQHIMHIQISAIHYNYLLFLVLQQKYLEEKQGFGAVDYYSWLPAPKTQNIVAS